MLSNNILLYGKRNASPLRSISKSKDLEDILILDNKSQAFKNNFGRAVLGVVILNLESHYFDT